MTLDRAVLAERAAAVERHLQRVASRLPPTPAGLTPATDASDSVILHLWQATQIVIDLALSTCVSLKLGTPSSYADAFRRLADAGAIDAVLAERLARAAGFRNVVAHAHEPLDMARVHLAATSGPADLRAFLFRLADLSAASADCATGRKPKGAGPHVLRHTFCSHLAMRRAPARAIQELAGHRDLTTTQRYMHLSPLAIEAAIRLMEPERWGIRAAESTFALRATVDSLRVACQP